MPKIRYLSTGESADLSTADLVDAHKRIVANSPTFAQKVADIEASGIPVTVRVVDGNDANYQALAVRVSGKVFPGHEEAFAFTMDIGNPPSDILVYISYQFLQKTNHRNPHLLHGL